MTSTRATHISKFLSLVLRHQPEVAGVVLNGAGWVEVKALLEGCAKAGHAFSRAELEEVVETNSKKRFEFSEDGCHIRASQGHSVEVELAYTPKAPPEVLYHGTATRFLDSILAQGLLKQQRHHVHLSAEVATAREVGSRHGSPLVLNVRAAAMQAAGHEFYLSTNGVWLVAQVPVEFIVFP